MNRPESSDNLPLTSSRRSDSPLADSPLVTSPESSSSLSTTSQRLIIRASAGTGKTFQLSSRYISILRRSSPEKILASTFTRKAAGEILERVLLRLAKATQDDQALQELADSVGPPKLDRSECLQLLARLTRNLHRVRISTLDAFFSQLAGSYALELGLSAGWRVLAPLEISQLREAAILEMLDSGHPRDLIQLMHLLDKGQTTRSVSRLITETIQNFYHVFLSAPAESWDRFPRSLLLSAEERLANSVLIQEYELDKKSLQNARHGDLLAIEAEDWDSLLKKGLLPKVISGEMKYSRVPIPEGLRAPYEALYPHILGSLIEPWKHQNLAARQLLNDYHTAFERLKHSAGGLEFGDVTRKLSAWQQESNLSESTFRLDASIEHLLLDEFQDTSPQQWNVIKTFAEEACRLPGRSFFCVGDTKQAIYGWRGGEAELFDLILDQLPGGHEAAMELNKSYRSSPVIMDTVNLVMRNMIQHDNFPEHDHRLNIWKQNFPEHTTTRTHLSGYACLVTLSDRTKKDDTSEKKPFDPDADEEVTQDHWTEVAEYVKARHLEAPAATIGVLTRKNASIGRIIYELNRLGLSASEEGGNPLTDSAVVQLILSLMTLADHPGDTIAAFHVANSPLAQIFEWREWNVTSSRVEFSSRLRRTLLDRGYGGLIHEILPKLAASCDRREYLRLLQLAEFGDRYDVLLADLRPSGFVKFIQEQKKEEPSSAKIRVMSVHQSKGLEFDIVILPELDAKLYLPPKYVSSSPGPGEPPDLVALYRNSQTFDHVQGELQAAQIATRDRQFQEALCLLYVALTRAVRSLHLLIQFKESKSLPKSFSGLLRAGLASGVPMAPQKILWETGRPEWYLDAPAKTQAELPASEKSDSEEPHDLGISFAESNTQRHHQKSTPTGLKSKGRTTLAEQFEQPAMGMLRGTVLHCWLQHVDWMDTAICDSKTLLTQARTFGVPHDMLTGWASDFIVLFESDWLKNLLSRSHYTGDESPFSEEVKRGLSSGELQLTVRNELPFSLLNDSQDLLSGIMDRVVIVTRNSAPVAVDVVDFKSDFVVDAADLAKRETFYALQMQSYRESIQKLLQLPEDCVSVRLAFLHPQKLQKS